VSDEAVAPDQPVPDDEDDRASTAARQALARARAGAAARGVRRGAPGPRKRRLAGEPRLSGSRSDERDPQEFGVVLDRLVAERGWQVDVAVGGVIGRWSGVVGPRIAEHCAPESFADGVLVVRADSTAWATQVRLLAPTLLGRLGDELGEGVVTRVQVRGPGSPTWRRGRRSVPGRGPRDTYG
jgi:predicted nucleic acid-binding Zn ribbon protein